MGVVFFVGFLFVLLIIAIVLICLSLGFMVTTIVLQTKKRKAHIFLILTVASGILGLLFAIIPTGSFIFFDRINEEQYPTIGQVIDQKDYQDTAFSVDGEKYVRLPYDSHILIEDCHPVFTYTISILFWRFNAGYYYQLNEQSMDFSLYVEPRGDLFAREEEYDQIIAHYESHNWYWLLNGFERVLESDEDVFDRIEAIFYSDDYEVTTRIPDEYLTLEHLSHDSYVSDHFMRIYYDQTNYYLYIDHFFDEAKEEINYHIISLTGMIKDTLSEYLS